MLGPHTSKARVEDKQIYSVALHLVFNANSTYRLTTPLRVPFPVTDILFRTPVSSFANIGIENEHGYSITTDLIVGIVGCVAGCALGDDSIGNSLSAAQNIGYDFRRRYQYPTTIDGSYTFELTSILDGQKHPLTGGVILPIEFIGYNRQPENARRRD
jgi:hypothetical protein